MIWKKKVTWKRFLFGILFLLVLLFSAGVAIWMQGTMEATDSALESLQSNQGVDVVQSSGMIRFEPVEGTASTGFIFYPGAGVDHRAYAPLLHQIASHGYLVVIPSMPLNLAFFNANVADKVMEQYPDVATWAIGGHSLGGVVAGDYAAKHPSVDGVIFWASYPGGNALIEKDIPVFSIYGSADGLATPQQINDSRVLLPADAMFFEIEGGNHSQFGSYGFQSGDNPATITPEEQWTQIVEGTVNFLSALSK